MRIPGSMSIPSSASSNLTSTPPPQRSFVSSEVEDKSQALHQVNQALEAYLDGPQEPRPWSPVPVDPRAISRNNFLYICHQNGAVYEAARQLIKDEIYWEAEERHFRNLNDRILSYNIATGHRVTLADVICPPMEVIKRLVLNYQRTLIGGRLPWFVHFWKELPLIYSSQMILRRRLTHHHLLRPFFVPRRTRDVVKCSAENGYRVIERCYPSLPVRGASII